MAFYCGRNSNISPCIEGTPCLRRWLRGPLKNYFGDTAAALTWLNKPFDGCDFFKNVLAQRTKYRLLCNPDSTECPSVCTILSGLLTSRKLTLHQVNNCAPDDGAVSSHFLLHDIFTLNDDPGTRGFVPPPGNSPVSECWMNRCFSLAGNNSFDGEFFDVIIAWLQRHQNAYIWTDCVPIIPISIMREVSIMQALFDTYRNANMIARTPWSPSPKFF